MIYVHIPLCRSFCTYCGFYSELCSGGQEEKTVDALVREISEEEIPLQENTIYIGGGTPSVLPPFLLERIVAVCREKVSQAPWTEFTIEANPDDIVRGGREYVAALKGLGVTRVSMGAQSFSDDILRWMNRRHSAADTAEAVRLLREGGIENISIDLIFGISHLSDNVLEESLHRALNLGVQHISCYQLSVEEGSALEKMVDDGRYVEASEDFCRGQYELISEKLRSAGFHHYEISNFALPGFEARHNSAYWRHVPYVGIGPGAHSLLKTADGGWMRRWNNPDLDGYVRRGAERGCEILSPEQVIEEDIMLGLRTSGGVDAALLEGNSRAEALLGEGRMELECSRIRIPEKFFFISDSIIRDII